VRALFRDEIVAGITGALVIALVELATLGGGIALSLVVLVLFAGLGLAIGAAMAASGWAVRRFSLPPLAAAAARALPALIVLIPVGATLFEGGRASTLPGAATAPYWFPAVTVLLLTGGLWLADRLLRGWLGLSARAGRTAVLVAIALLTVAAELANRRLYPTEYPRLHLMLIVVSAAAVAVGCLLSAGPIPPRRAIRIRLGVVTAVVALVAAALSFGMTDERDRWVVATRGNHAGHLAGLARTLVDLDRDGYAAVLGGGDCDDADSARNPGADDRPGNGIDEDCDGVDAEPVVVHADTGKARDLDQVRAAQDSRALIDRMAGADLLMISIDALRADQLAPTAANRAAFPNLTGLLAGSRWFVNAVAPSAGTDVSLSSLMTGMIDPFVRRDTTLLEALAASGRAVHAVLPTEVLRWAPRRLLLRGAGSHDEVVNDRHAENVGDYTTSIETTDRAIAFVDQLTDDRRFALWVHYFDVHEHQQIKASDHDLAALGGDLSTTEGKYRSLLRLTDREIGRLLARIGDRGRPVVVVLFSDHGESLGEDERLPDNHGLYVYNALTAIPLAIRLPGIEPMTIAEPVSLIDLYPTLVELFGLAGPDDLAGDSQFLYLVPEPPPAPHHPGRVLVVNESDQWGVIEWPYKLMIRPKENLTELYDLSADPAEQTNLAGEQPARVRRLKQLYRRFPKVSFDRSRKGRRWREAQARPPRRR
jgi:hypothetical protein